MCGFVTRVGLTLSTSTQQTVLGDFPDKVVGVNWGPASHNLQFGFAIPANVSNGQAMLVQLYVKNDGPPIVITRIGDPREYNVVIHSSDGQVVREKSGAFYPSVTHGGQHPLKERSNLSHVI
jgi:hypothetical protein